MVCGLIVSCVSVMHIHESVRTVGNHGPRNLKNARG